MALIISWQFMDWPDSWSTLAAASKALSLPVAAASSLALAVFLLLAFRVRWAIPAAALRPVQPSFAPLMEPSVSVPATAWAVAAPFASGLDLLLLLAMSGLPNRGS